MLRLVEPPIASPPEVSLVSGWFLRLSGRLAGTHRLRETCDAVGPAASPVEFARRLLELLDVRCDLDDGALARIPRTGRTLFVANHPLGPLDELITIAVLGAVRPDLRVLAHAGRLAVPQLDSLILGARRPRGRDVARDGTPALRDAVRWLAAERAVLTFPAGEVANYDVRARCVTDPPWNPATGRLVELTDAQVVPVNLTGVSGTLFPAVGTLSPRLRRLLVPRELHRRRGAQVGVHVGAPIAAARLSRFHDGEAVAVHLRLKTLLANARVAPDETLAPRALSPIPAEMPRDALAAEVSALPADGLLLQQGGFDVHLARAPQIPHLLSEIGRLREIAFRAAGSGTGRPRDLDRFDREYEHLLIWHRASQRLVGCCRLGRVDEIRARAGSSGLNSATRFRFRKPALRLLGAALELDRPFIRDGHADDPAAAMLLWKGVGEYIAREPRYCRLLGTVTVGGDYSDTSRQLLVGYLARQKAAPLLSRLVRARHPLVRSRPLGALATELGLLSNVDPLGTLIEDIETDGKGVPPVLRQYLRLGGRVLGLGVHENGAATDCLLMVDLRFAKPRALARFMSDQALARFAGAHALRFPAGLSSNRAPPNAAD